MDAYNPYLRPRPPPPPPPSSTADPQYHYQYPPPRPPAPPPPQPSWTHSNQFQYQTSPSPPPAPQWAPPPPSYPPPPPHPYPPTYLNHQFPPPPPPPPTQYPNSYPPQEWSNPNWGYQHSWNHPDSNAEDWAARAKAWADAKAAVDNQHPQSQYTAPTGRLEEQNHYQNHYAQTVDSHYPENHEQLHSGAGYQEYALSSAPPNGQLGTINGSGSSSYLPDGHVPYLGRDGALTADRKATFPQQESLPSSQSIHQQEVPSSYSSVSGQSMVSHLSVSAAQEGVHVQPPIPAAGASVPAEQSFAYGSHLSEPMADPANQPLQFTPRFSRDQDSLIPAGYVHNIDPVGNTASVNAWPSSMVPDATYSSIPPSLTQSDPSMSVASHLPGQAAASFPRFPAPNFQSTIPSPSASFGIGAGVGLPPSAPFAGDGYGVSNISERPKKAPVPNWLREEIIKTKASIASTSLGHAKDEEQSLEDEGIDKFQKNDPADGKSHESSRSTEDNEDDDEDYVEAARTAAINKEIKRVLTEVLLKVTDELFDEIAIKVLDEDDIASDDDHELASAGNKVVPSIGASTTSKAPVNVHLPAAAKELDTGHSEKSSSSSEGNVLGLVNYTSDDDKDVGDEEVMTSMPISTRGSTPTSSDDRRILNTRNDTHQNSKFGSRFEERVKNQASLEIGSDRATSFQNGSVGGGDSICNEIDELEPAQTFKEAGDDGMNSNGPDVLDGAHASMSVGLRNPTSFDAEGRETAVKSAGTGKDESRRFSSGQASSKEPERAKTKGDEKLDDKIRRKEEKHQRKEKTERHELKDNKEQGKSGERMKESQSKKRSSDHETREERKGSERSHKSSYKGDYNRGSERKDREESRSGRENDSSRHKRRRSSSMDSRGRNGKDDKNSSDEASYDSRRKSRSRKRNLSPSPVRSRRRQVSRSPHSKHSQRKHSPYSSLENTRGRRRSRSRSPVRRQR